MDKVTSSELNSGVNFEIEIRIQFRNRVEASIRLKDGKRGRDRDRG